MNEIYMKMDYVWDAMLKHYQRYTPKLTNNCLVDNME